jgi:hypothetical protein
MISFVCDRSHRLSLTKGVSAIFLALKLTGVDCIRNVLNQSYFNRTIESIKTFKTVDYLSFSLVKNLQYCPPVRQIHS